MNKAELLKTALMNFYNKPQNLKKFADVINKKTPYSLRIIEWFCNNYSKKYDVIYKTSVNKLFNVYVSYKIQLDSFQKKQFDPFKRHHKGFETFEIKYKDTILHTTVGQLNFFKWCITNEVFEYIEKNLNHIKMDMNTTLTLSKKNKNKRQQLNIAATRVCIKRYNSVYLDF